MVMRPLASPAWAPSVEGASFPEANSARTLRTGFIRSAQLHPERVALEVAETRLTFNELRQRAASIAATLQQHDPGGAHPALTAVFAHRTVTAFAGILGALFRGHGYVPLNRTMPPARTRGMLERSGCRAVVLDLDSASQLGEVLEGIEEGLLLLLPEVQDVSELRKCWPKHTVLGESDLLPATECELMPVDPDAVAYLLFTSGSTGIPKGVMVAHRNVIAFIGAMVERYGITETDRFSQTFDMTFDLSVFDMFVAWERGACVCCPSPRTVIKPGKFISDSSLTVWFSVPSTGLFMKRLGMLKPGRYPSLRWSLFCGEPLPATVAEEWGRAAPNSVVENLYGPTELTLACMLYRWDPERSQEACQLGWVPIGHPYPRMQAVIVDERRTEVGPGEAGELLMTGPQVALGYWNDPARTAEAFVALPGRDGIYYRTGDRVRSPSSPSEPFVYLGRVDHQIKVRGFRVELGEVEATLREESDVDAVVAVAWPLTESGAAGIQAFVADTRIDPTSLRARLEKRLPEYMIPRQIHLVESLPLNANGKFDRKELLSRLEAME